MSCCLRRRLPTRLAQSIRANHFTDAHLIHIYLISLFSRLSRDSLHIEFWTRLPAGWKQTGQQDERKENSSGRVDGWGRRGKPRACCSAMWRRDHQPSQSRPCIMSDMQGHPAESSGLYGGWDGRSHTNGRQHTLTHARHGAALQKWLVKKVGVIRRMLASHAEDSPGCF